MYVPFSNTFHLMPRPLDLKVGPKFQNVDTEGFFYLVDCSMYLMFVFFTYFFSHLLNKLNISGFVPFAKNVLITNIKEIQELGLESLL